ncbi:hypothetical protein [Breznakia pachnodae]|uniref:Uncharacterized protein n=1 Tax=Breznakia pachnodae TaxID=265178 RepID=A0ABU0E530_9FIRM|nr:hypothetical protein [Breznakia pachnodae]MDQ0362012.1 hypothetical protein [Breznakia pachnodae]
MKKIILSLISIFVLTACRLSDIETEKEKTSNEDNEKLELVIKDVNYEIYCDSQHQHCEWSINYGKDITYEGKSSAGIPNITNENGLITIKKGAGTGVFYKTYYSQNYKPKTYYNPLTNSSTYVAVIDYDVIKNEKVLEIVIIDIFSETEISRFRLDTQDIVLMGDEFTMIDHIEIEDGDLDSKHIVISYYNKENVLISDIVYF